MECGNAPFEDAKKVRNLGECDKHVPEKVHCPDPQIYNNDRMTQSGCWDQPTHFDAVNDSGPLKIEPRERKDCGQTSRSGGKDVDPGMGTK